MPALNTTGVPKTGDYLLGRGILYFAELDGSGNPKAWRDLGNVTDFKVTVSSEELIHETSRSGTKVEDLAVALKRAANWSAVLDTIENDNLALFGAATLAAVTNPAVAGFAEHSAYTSVELGRWYDIVSSTGARAYDIAKANLTLEKSGSPDVALVEDTDYTVDEQMGRVFLKSTASNIAAGDTLDITLAADAGAAANVKEVRFLQETAIRGALKFVGENPQDGVKFELQLHNVNVEGDGDLGLISDEWVTLPLKGKVSKSDSTRFTSSPYASFRTLS
jgi:hypothetical protein